MTLFSGNDPEDDKVLPKKPTLSDQHWRASLHGKKRSDIADDLIQAVEDGNLWRLDVLLDLSPDFEHHEDCMKAAVDNGHMYIFQRLSSLKEDWDKVYDLQVFARYAAHSGQVAFLRYFVEQKNVDISVHQEDMLAQAAGNGHLAVVDYLLLKGTDPMSLNGASLKAAVEKGALDVLQRLSIESGVDLAIENSCLLLGAAMRGHTQMLKFLLERGVRDIDSEAMCAAAREDQIGSLAELIAAGASGKDRGSRAFLEAVYYDKQAAASFLLKNGADVNAADSDALRHAVSYRDEKNAAFLLENGADPNLTRNGEKLLAYAAWIGDLSLVRLLLKHGADHTAQQYEALRSAAQRRHRDIVRELIARDKAWLAEKRQEKSDEFFAVFGDAYSVDDLRQKKGSSGESGLLIAAQTGLFDKLLKKASGTLAPEDIFHPDMGPHTVFSHLKKHKALSQFFNPDLWEGRAQEIEAAHKILPPAMQLRFNIPHALAEIHHNDLQKKMRKTVPRPPRI